MSRKESPDVKTAVYAALDAFGLAVEANQPINLSSVHDRIASSRGKVAEAMLRDVHLPFCSEQKLGRRIETLLSIGEYSPEKFRTLIVRYQLSVESKRSQAKSIPQDLAETN